MFLSRIASWRMASCKLFITSVEWNGCLRRVINVADAVIFARIASSFSLVLTDTLEDAFLSISSSSLVALFLFVAAPATTLEMKLLLQQEKKKKKKKKRVKKRKCHLRKYAPSHPYVKAITYSCCKLWFSNRFSCDLVLRICSLLIDLLGLWLLVPPLEPISSSWCRYLVPPL